MEPMRGRSRVRGEYYGRQSMSLSRSRSRGGAFAGARASGRAGLGPGAVYRARGVVARRARAMLNTRTAGFLGIETKFYDTALVAGVLAAPTDATGSEFDPSATSMISTPAVGDSEQNRDGKRIIIKNLSIKGVVRFAATINQTVIPNGEQIYLAIVLDTQSNGAQMNSEDCFKNTGANAALAASPQRNLLFANRFRILKEFRFNVPAPAVSWDGTNIELGGTDIQWETFLPLNLPVNFNAGTTASIANVIDNSLHVICYANNITRAPSISYNARIRFQG